MILPIRWEPLFKDLEEMFKDFSVSFLPSFGADVYETDNEFVVEANLPGVKKENIEIKYVDGYLSIEATLKEDVEEKKRNYYRQERRRGSFVRRFLLPENVDVSKAKASLKDGVLTIRLPKTEKKDTGVQIKIE